MMFAAGNVCLIVCDSDLYGGFVLFEDNPGRNMASGREKQAQGWMWPQLGCTASALHTDKEEEHRLPKQ